MIDQDHLLLDVQQAEGCRLEAYADSLGYWTAGWGHYLYPNDGQWRGTVFTLEQCQQWLTADLVAATTAAMGLPEWPFLDTPARQNALVELVFNMGVEHWKLFVHTRQAIQQQDWHAAHDGLLDSLWAKQVGPVRSTRLADYLLSGVFE